jgi:hypothetical protein
MQNKTGHAAPKTGARAQPKPPFPKQYQTAPGTVLQVMGGETTGG